MRIAYTAFLSVLLLGSSVLAGEANPKPLVLDEDRRSAFSARNELFVFSGFYFGKTLDNSFVAGGEYLYRFTHTWALGPSFTYTKAETTNSVQLSQPGFFQSDHIYTTDLAVMIAMPAAFAAGDTLVQANLYSILGAGAIDIDDAWQPHGFIGGGMKIFPGIDWMAIRVDIRTGLHPIDTPAGKKFDQNLSLMVGLSFLIPPQVGFR